MLLPLVPGRVTLQGLPVPVDAQGVERIRRQGMRRRLALVFGVVSVAWFPTSTQLC
ncbi:hypothetical protein ACFSC4_18755 [Deinococcus malanensis]|uniref:hypothetical protein n=1 Tax=Deinococcus malanensis TaxID=1706855 RepID=UPI003645C753